MRNGTRRDDRTGRLDERPSTQRGGWTARWVLTALVASGLAGVAAAKSFRMPATTSAAAPQASSAQEAADGLTKAERAAYLRAQQIATLRARAAEAAETSAADLEAVSARLEALAIEARAAADQAQQRARAARQRADAARRRANEAAAAARRIGPDPVPGQPLGDGQRAPSKEAATGEATEPKPTPRRIGSRRPVDRDKSLAATRPAPANKKGYLNVIRAGRPLSPKRTRLVETLTQSPGEAPDMADLDIFAEWQWGVNVARGRAVFGGKKPGSIPKTGHVDIARVSFQPAVGKASAADMKWGMRRYNLGDVTVVDCDFTAIPKEHGIYDNLSGHALYEGNTFLDLGGQAIQIAHRALPYNQYKADNMPLTGKPIVIVDDCHAVDCGQDASRSGFTWTFFDVGTQKFPSTIVLRDCTTVHAWETPRGRVRAPGALVVHQYQQGKGQRNRPAVESLVIDDCLFDLTQGDKPLAAVRGVGRILIEDSTFLARNHTQPYFDVDDQPDRPSGKIVLQNCLSPAPHTVTLRVRGSALVPLHCPGKRIEIDVATLVITETEIRDEPITRIVSPLEGRRVMPGVHAQPPGHVDDLGTVEPVYAEKD